MYNVPLQLYNIPMITTIQVKMARAALGLGVRDLAKISGVTANTISNFENGNNVLASTLNAIEKSLEKKGIEFLTENGVRLKRKK